MSDRREQPRFEIIGRLRGSVATAEPVRVLNVSTGGALVEAPWTLPLESVVTIRMRSGAAQHDARVRVRHVRPSWDDGKGFLVGLEFVAGESASHEGPEH